MSFANLGLVLIGKQGAGKGTQGAELSKHYDIPHISTGEMFRELVRLESPTGKELKQYIAKGELIPDETVIKAVKERLSFPDCAHGFILDGFPRTITQAEALSDLGTPSKLDLVINLEIPTRLVLQRLTRRRVCSNCGANYSLDSPPKVPWICDVCNGKVTKRVDDTEQVIQKRLHLYEDQTRPLLQWYKTRGLLVDIDASRDSNEVTRQIVNAIDQKLKDKKDSKVSNNYEDDIS